MAIPRPVSVMRYQRQQAVIDRGGYHSCMCDRCGVEKATECHHILPRGRVGYASEDAQCLVSDRRLLAMLCRECHIGKNNAHTPAATDELFRLQIQRYGYAAVKQAFQNVLDAIKVKQIGVEFPKKEQAMRG